MSRIERKLAMLPDRSGVYIFRDERERVLYIGKAKRLHLRVRSYFRSRADDDTRLAMLVERIADIDTIITGNEIEALILEANLIKRHRPPYNVELKDDKRFPYLKLTTYHQFPGLYLTRKIVDDGSRYFGPYTHVKDLRHTLKRLRKVFPLRNCTDRRIDRGERECLEYFIDRCPAPCTGRVDKAGYKPIVRRLVRFLEGDMGQVVKELRAQMQEHADALRYEEAGKARDDIETLERLVLQQRMTPALVADTDVVAVVARGDQASCVALHVREGKVLGHEHRLLLRTGGRNESELLYTFLSQTYLETPQIPEQIVTGVAPRGSATLQSMLKARAGHAVKLRVAKRGNLTRLLEAARDNAHMRLEEQELKDRRRRSKVDPGVYDLQERLDLPRTPYRIEGFDISNFQESHAVASQVCFQDGIALKSGYRRFRIKQTQGPDDVAMIGEVLRRRLRRLKTQDDPEPDLILIDGGKGQVGRAMEVLSEEGLGGIQLLGLAKREELVVIPGVAEPVRLPRTAEALRLLQRIRNEAHRFAISYHRKLRGRAQVRSALDRVPGIGPKRRRLLLRRFGSVDSIRRQSPEALAEVEGIGLKSAQKILDCLRKSTDKVNDVKERA